MRTAITLLFVLSITLAGCKTDNETAALLHECECGDYAVIFNDSSSLAVPNYFTPNTDGVNDTFFPFVTGADSIRFKVTNANNEIFFNTDTVGAGWDGKISGVDAGPGKYYFSLYAEFPGNLDTLIHGNFCMVRECFTSNLSGCTAGSQYNGQFLDASLSSGETYGACEE
jgi:gliding motility-associated-like protein